MLSVVQGRLYGSPSGRVAAERGRRARQQRPRMKENCAQKILILSFEQGDGKHKTNLAHCVRVVEGAEKDVEHVEDDVPGPGRGQGDLYEVLPEVLRHEPGGSEVGAGRAKVNLVRQLLDHLLLELLGGGEEGGGGGGKAQENEMNVHSLNFHILVLPNTLFLCSEFFAS